MPCVGASHLMTGAWASTSRLSSRQPSCGTTLCHRSHAPTTSSSTSSTSPSSTSSCSPLATSWATSLSSSFFHFVLLFFCSFHSTFKSFLLYLLCSFHFSSYFSCTFFLITDLILWFLQLLVVVFCQNTSFIYCLNKRIVFLFCSLWSFEYHSLFLPMLSFCFDVPSWWRIICLPAVSEQRDKMGLGAVGLILWLGHIPLAIWEGSLP